MMRDAYAASNLTSADQVPTDAELVSEAQGDPRAFAALYDRYRDRIYWYLLTRTNSAEDADDLLQQVFLKALDALGQYRPARGPFAAWLFGIARHTTATFQARRRPTVAWDLVPEVLLPVDEHDLEAQLVRREDLGRLRRCFGRLEAHKRELLILRFVTGLTMSEIAAVIGKSEAATKKQLARTLRALKEYYDGPV
jgi:RNA polymerase sigma-70 factor (ECF subfamily)